MDGASPSCVGGADFGDDRQYSLVFSLIPKYQFRLRRASLDDRDELHAVDSGGGADRREALLYSLRTIGPETDFIATFSY